MSGVRERLIGLLDYVEQVVRLDERVAFRLSEYRLADSSTFALHPHDTNNLPGIRHNVRDADDAVWLEVERLTRKEPPAPPEELADWIALSADPSQLPQTKNERLTTVCAAERDKAIADGKVRPEDVMEAPRAADETAAAPKKFDLRLRLEDNAEIALETEKWIAGPWQEWSAREVPRRKTIAIYQKLYKIFQLIEIGVSESPIEVVWGAGFARWHKDGRIIERPLLERRVDIELDDAKGGLIRVRPTTGPASFDLKPYEEFGCPGLAGVADLIQRELRRTEEDEGVQPLNRDTYEPILWASAARLDPDGSYVSGATESQIAEAQKSARLIITDEWVLFARPRSQHVILQDINRLKKVVADSKEQLTGLANRLVTEPSRVAEASKWGPLTARIGESGLGSDNVVTEGDFGTTDVFFPKPFNGDQYAIVQRLQNADGLVVQGPPGTGKTHTIANLICHAMATGQRVLVVSRGESALSVLRLQLPEEVQPLAIAVTSSEREGLKQIESAIRQIQAVVDGGNPAARRKTIHQFEQEIAELQKTIAAIDVELDEIAGAHLTGIGPRKEAPADLAKRIVSEREAYSWMTDRPLKFASETSLSDENWAALDSARRRVGDFLDHSAVVLPSSADLPTSSVVATWHENLLRVSDLEKDIAAGPAKGVRVEAQTSASALAVAHCLELFITATERLATYPWLKPLFRSAVNSEHNEWLEILRERLAEWQEIDAERAGLVRRPVRFPAGLLEDHDACQAVSRAAKEGRPWPLLSIRSAASKLLVAAIKLEGFPVKDGDKSAWQHVQAVINNLRRISEATVRWNGLVDELGGAVEASPRAQIESARLLHNIAVAYRDCSPLIPNLISTPIGSARLMDEPRLCAELAKQLKNAVALSGLASTKADIARVKALFDRKTDRTSALFEQLFVNVLGNAATPTSKLEPVWNGLLKRLETLSALRPSFVTIISTTEAISSAGAPLWAQRLRSERVKENEPHLASIWRGGWDYAAADGALARIDARKRLTVLAQKREVSEGLCRKRFGELVRERTYYTLDQRLSPSVKSALVQFVRSLARIGKGTGKGAGANRSAARLAMARCYDAVPCWIMPTWRVAEQLPPEIGAIDLVIIDEASQSDVTELPALLRGRKLLVVGDDRQVSPTPPFVTQSKLSQLRHHYLGELPFSSLLEPGESIYDLMRAVFPDHKLMLKEHFRCVEPIIQFSMQFYPEKMLPLRIPKAEERLDPPLVDIYLPHGVRDLRRKINCAEAEVIVDEIEKIVNSEGKVRSIGVISLIGSEQADFIRGKLSEVIGEELMQRHAVLCGDSATFQGTERDIVFLSMVADPAHKTALTMLRYEQRFNVAVSRARDRVILVRSVKREELNPRDMKARLIQHFDDPMPIEAAVSGTELERCESEFERDMLRVLAGKGYRVRAQVGSIGYRIDIVVEGSDGRRLAVECDGDRFHGPDKWREDMHRQRVLERIGWRFWRCFASSFYRDRESVVTDLLETLAHSGIAPFPQDAGPSVYRFTDHRVIEPKITPEDTEISPIDSVSESPAGEGEKLDRAIVVGDRLNLVFADGKKRMSVRLSEKTHDPDNGYISIGSPLGQAMLGAEEGDEVEFRNSDGLSHTVLIESATRPELLPTWASHGSQQ